MTSPTQYTDPAQVLQPSSGPALHTKLTDPRYIPGVSANDDDMTDAEWFDAMGTPAPAPVVAPAAPVWEAPENPAAEAWKHFSEYTANHRLTVIREDGLYRHFRMSEPGTGMYSWEIITWPWHLATAGDIADGLILSREADMVDFISLADGKRSYYSDGAPSIDFRYWAEKLQGDQRQTVRGYKHALFLEYVTETVEQHLKDDHRGMTRTKADELISDAKYVDEYSHAALEWLNDHEDIFPDPWDHDFTDYTYHFQVACYAINAAVQAYLDHETAAGWRDAAEAAGAAGSDS